MNHFFVNKSYFANLALVGVTFTWGATFILIKEAINIVPPFTFMTTRFLIAALLLALFILIFYRKALKLCWQKEIWLPGILLGFCLFFGYAFQTFGLQYTTASKAGFITGSSVIIVPFLSRWFLHHSLRSEAMLGILLATLGLLMLSHSREFSANLGDILIFLSAIFYAFHITLVARYTRLSSSLPLTLIQIFSCGFLSLACTSFFENISASFLSSIFLNKKVFFAIIICSVFATTFAYAIQNYFQKFTSPTHTALIFITEPVFAALVAYLYAGELLSITQIFGCLFMLAGMLVSELKFTILYR